VKPFPKALCTGLALAILLGVAPAAAGEDPEVVAEVLEILKDRGLVDESRYTELVAKNQAWEAEQEQESLFGRIEWYGDVRMRFENFWFREDPTGFQRSDRNRLRWRLRVGGKIPINDWVTADFRIASGVGEPRSTNETFGQRVDFGPGGIYIDRVTLDFKLPTFVENTKTNLVVGKMSNPFRWKKGKDYFVWDGDLNPEGVAVKFRYMPTDAVGLYANTGYFIIDENAVSADAHFFGLQGGADWAINEEVEVGGRVSWYAFHSLDAGFFTAASRSLAFGNTTDVSKGNGVNVVEVSAYAGYDGFEDWPILLVGNYVQNFNTDDLLDKKQGLGVGGSVEVGDKKKWFMLGAGYYYSQANYFPAQFPDSDLFDGRSNRKGWNVYGARTIMANTDLKFSLFGSRVVDSSIPPYLLSVRNSDRIRLQTDVVVKF
jgi:hypothetical protein